MIKIVFANHKGGVGKTACSLIFASVLSAAPYNGKVLAIDMDPQGNLTDALAPRGVGPLDIPSVDICLRDKNATKRLIVDSWLENVHLIGANLLMEKPFPSDVSFSGQELPFIHRIPLKSLHNALETVQNDYDYIVIDCAPSVGLATQAALFTADLLLLPCSPSKHAISGMPDMIELARKTKEAANETIKYAVLATLADRRLRLDKVGLSMLSARFNVVGEIPKCSRIAENITGKRHVLAKLDDERKNILLKTIENAVASPHSLRPAE